MASDRLYISSDLSAEHLRALRTEAAELRRELEGLQAGTEAFEAKLRQLRGAEQPLQTIQKTYRDTAAASEQGADAEAAAQARRLEQGRAFNELRLQDQAAFHEAAAAEQIAYTDRRMQDMRRLSSAQAEQVERERELARARVEIAGAAADAFRAMNNVFGQGQREFAAAQKALFLFSRAMAIRDVIVNTQKEISTIQATYAAAPPVAAALTAKAIAASVLRVSTIAAQTVPKLARGGVLKGASHAGGGIHLVDSASGTVTAEAEGGEVILTRGVSEQPALMAIASQLNELAGGVRLSRASHSPQMARGGVVSPADGGADTALLRRLTELADRPSVVSVREIADADQRVKALEEAARF